MPVGPRFAIALSEFSVFTFVKPKTSDLENSDFSKTGQSSLKRYKLKKLAFGSLMTITARGYVRFEF